MILLMVVVTTMEFHVTGAFQQRMLCCMKTKIEGLSVSSRWKDVSIVILGGDLTQISRLLGGQEDWVNRLITTTYTYHSPYY